MLALSPSDQQVASQLVVDQHNSGQEHFWANEHVSGKIFHGSGLPDRVIVPPILVAAFDDPTCAIRYHHSHPDERALSPSDLDLLARIGVTEVWAHTAGGGSYGAVLQQGVLRSDYDAKLKKLHGHMDVRLIPTSIATVSPIQFEAFRDLAACEALEIAGLISAHIRLSDEMRRKLLHEFLSFGAIRTYFESVL